MVNKMKDFKEWLQSRSTKIARKCLRVMDKNTAVIWESNYDIFIDPINSSTIIPNYLFNQFQIYKSKTKKILGNISQV